MSSDNSQPAEATARNAAQVEPLWTVKATVVMDGDRPRIVPDDLPAPEDNA